MKLIFQILLLMHTHSLTDTHTHTVLGCRVYSDVAIRNSRVTDRIIKITSTTLLICVLDTSFSIPVCVRAFQMLRWYPYPSICLVKCRCRWYISYVSAYILHKNNAFLHPNPPLLVLVDVAEFLNLTNVSTQTHTLFEPEHTIATMTTLKCLITTTSLWPIVPNKIEG